MLYILAGLESGFDPLVMIVKAKASKADAYTVEEVSSLLFSLEKRRNKHSVEQFSINMASSRGGRKFSGKDGGQSYNRGGRSSSDQHAGNTSYRGRSNYGGANKGGRTQINRP